MNGKDVEIRNLREQLTANKEQIEEYLRERDHARTDLRAERARNDVLRKGLAALRDVKRRREEESVACKARDEAQEKLADKETEIRDMREQLTANKEQIEEYLNERDKARAAFDEAKEDLAHKRVALQKERAYSDSLRNSLALCKALAGTNRQPSTVDSECPIDFYAVACKARDEAKAELASAQKLLLEQQAFSAVACMERDNAKAELATAQMALWTSSANRADNLLLDLRQCQKELVVACKEREITQKLLTEQQDFSTAVCKERDEAKAELANARKLLLGQQCAKDASLFDYLQCQRERDRFKNDREEVCRALAEHAHPGLSPGQNVGDVIERLRKAEKKIKDSELHFVAADFKPGVYGPQPAEVSVVERLREAEQKIKYSEQHLHKAEQTIKEGAEKLRLALGPFLVEGIPLSECVERLRYAHILICKKAAEIEARLKRERIRRAEADDRDQKSVARLKRERIRRADADDRAQKSDVAVLVEQAEAITEEFGEKIDELNHHDIETTLEYQQMDGTGMTTLPLTGEFQIVCSRRTILTKER